MRTLSFSKSVRDSLVRVLVGLIHLCNGSTSPTSSASESLVWAVQLLGLPNDCVQSLSAADCEALCGEIYERTLQSIIFLVNQKLHRDIATPTSPVVLRAFRDVDGAATAQQRLHRMLWRAHDRLKAEGIVFGVESTFTRAVGDMSSESREQSRARVAVAPRLLQLAAASRDHTIAALFAASTGDDVIASGGVANSNGVNRRPSHTVSVDADDDGDGNSVCDSDAWVVVCVNGTTPHGALRMQIEALQLLPCVQIRSQPSIAMEFRAFYLKYHYCSCVFWSILIFLLPGQVSHAWPPEAVAAACGPREGVSVSGKEDGCSLATVCLCECTATVCRRSVAHFLVTASVGVVRAVGGVVDRSQCGRFTSCCAGVSASMSS